MSFVVLSCPLCEAWSLSYDPMNDWADPADVEKLIEQHMASAHALDPNRAAIALRAMKIMAERS